MQAKALTKNRRHRTASTQANSLRYEEETRLSHVARFIGFMIAIVSLALLPNAFRKPVHAVSNAVQGTIQAFPDGKVDYRGVHFSYDKSVASEVKARIVPAEVASAQNEGPGDTIYPTHLAFELVGTYPAQPVSFIPSEIKIYPVAAYKQAFAADRKMVRQVSATILSLQRILRSRVMPPTGEVPYLPLPDGYLAFRAHNGILNFKEGSGIVFLTQGQQDEVPINNQNLSYEFQGITDDGKYYVTAEFPLQAPSLPNDRDTANYGGAVRESKCIECPDHARFMREYRAYALRVSKDLERLTPEKFQPSLKLFAELIGSIQIDQNTAGLINNK